MQEAEQGSVDVPHFSLVINLPGRSERIDMMAADHAPGQTIDMQPGQPGVTTVVLPDASGEADTMLDEDI